MNEDQHERLRGHRIRTTLKRVPGILADLEPTPKRGRRGRNVRTEAAHQ